MSSTREKRQLQLIEAAMIEFKNNGFHKSKIGDIAKTVGIGKGTVYEYFDSKKDLFEQMMRYIASMYYDMTCEVMEGSETVKNKMVAFARHHGKFISNHMDLAENNILEPGFLSEDMICEMIEIKQKIFLLIEKALEKGIETGELRPDLDKKVAIISILGAINQNYTMQVYFEKIEPEDVDPLPIIDTIFNGLAN